MPEHDIRAKMDGKRPEIVERRKPIRACLTRWTTDYDKFLDENKRTITPWGPSEYSWFDTLQAKVTAKCAHLDDIDNEIRDTYPVRYYQAELDAEELRIEEYQDKLNNLLNRCKAFAKEYVDLSAVVSARLGAAAVGPAALGGVHVAGMPTTAKLQLPKQKTPTFDGDQIKFPEFWDRFSPIDTNASLTNVQKLDYLKQCLTGSALNTISFLESVDRNYAVACDLLTNSYLNPRKIISAHIEKMINFAPLRTETVGGLRRLTESFNGHLFSLVVLGATTPR
jgi:hypothetical protein